MNKLPPPLMLPLGDRADTFVLFDTVTVDERTYALLLPVDPLADGLDAVVLRIDAAGDGTESLVALEDEAEWRRVVAAFTALLTPRRPRWVRKKVAHISTYHIRGDLRGSAPPARRFPRPYRVRV